MKRDLERLGEDGSEPQTGRGSGRLEGVGGWREW